MSEHDIFTIEGARAIAEDKSDNCKAMFYSKPKYMKAASEDAGRPVYEPRDYVKILVPGQRDYFAGPAKDEHKMRFRTQWEQYQSKKEQVVEGVPIEHARFLAPEQVATCKHLHIDTVEQLRDLADGTISKLGHGGRKLVELAGQYLQEDDETIQQLRAKVRELETKIIALEAPEQPEGGGPQAKRGPGRPKKVD